MKKIKLYLTEDNISKIESIAKENFENSNYKKSSIIRQIIDDVNFDELFLSDEDFSAFRNKFNELVKSGVKLNELMYNLNVEHIKYLEGKKNNYILDAEAFSSVLEELNSKIIKLKEGIKELSDNMKR